MKVLKTLDTLLLYIVSLPEKYFLSDECNALQRHLAEVKTLFFARNENRCVFFHPRCQRITVWKPFTCEGSFNIKPAFISRLVGRDFVDCRKTEILFVKDKDKNGKEFVHEIQRKEFDDYVHYQVTGSNEISLVGPYRFHS